jgi:hypothetical protein
LWAITVVYASSNLSTRAPGWNARHVGGGENYGQRKSVRDGRNTWLVAGLRTRVFGLRSEIVKRLALLVLFTLPLCLSLGMQTSINPVVEYSTASTLVDSRPFTLGYSFSTSVTFNLNALGAWDDGLGNNHQVGILGFRR